MFRFSFEASCEVANRQCVFKCQYEHDIVNVFKSNILCVPVLVRKFHKTCDIHDSFKRVHIKTLHLKLNF